MNNVLEWLEKSATNYPDKIAFADVENTITYKDLDLESDIIASILIRDEEVKERQAIAFYLEKCVDATVGMFATLKSRAFYSFIDLRSPKTRQTKVIETLMPKIIFTDDENYAEAISMFSSYPDTKIISLETLLSDVRKELETKSYEDLSERELLVKRRQTALSNDPVYVNFTSGSTGTPKGVVVGHASIIDFIEVFTKTFDLNKNDIWANQAPFDFDVSVKDIFASISVGGTVNIIPRSYFSNPTALMDYLVERKPTVLVWAVSAMCFVSIMNGFGYKVPTSVKKVIFSGEVMPIKQLNVWKKYLPEATYVNVYGPTEITCNCTYHVVDRDYDLKEVIPAGRAFENEHVFLLNDNDEEITSAGEVGEICVAGACLALGYYKDKDKTSKAFMPNPANHEFLEMMYRTGDLGRYDEDGLLYYVSRKDFQVKHMGQRIELGEIEVAASSKENVERSCCLYDNNKKKILLFVMGSADKKELLDELRKDLPSYMIPNKVIMLDEMPMTKNGKIDRNALKQVVGL